MHRGLFRHSTGVGGVQVEESFKLVGADKHRAPAKKKRKCTTECAQSRGSTKENLSVLARVSWALQPGLGAMGCAGTPRFSKPGRRGGARVHLGSLLPGLEEKGADPQRWIFLQRKKKNDLMFSKAGAARRRTGASRVSKPG